VFSPVYAHNTAVFFLPQLFRHKYCNTMYIFPLFYWKMKFFTESSLKCTFNMLNFRWDVDIMLIDTLYISGSQNTKKFITMYCTICYTATCFGPFSRPTWGCICLAMRVLYHDDNIRLFWWWHLNHLNLCLDFMVGVQAVQYGWLRTLGVEWRRCFGLFPLLFL